MVFVFKPLSLCINNYTCISQQPEVVWFTFQPPWKWALKHFILIEGYLEWFPSHYLHILSVCADRILTTKSPDVRRGVWVTVSSVRRLFRDAIDGLPLELEEKASRDTHEHPMLRGFLYTALVRSLLSSEQYVWNRFLARRALAAVAALLFVLDECWGNGAITLTCW